ncbi:DEKNAAC103334 [Brettanomyces naardenensis]|uniref:Obg-like ATPase homolog n=1 Tax=Brettanomyces naardenensis TaxID=13370 RepID=A0A448YP59_BRENA|nr:DEKNAAC103334 [Brettanomyces naardenensis]
MLRSYSTKATTSLPKLFGRPSNNLTSGIVGLANVGKSTFFQAITRSKLGNPANYPFATIKPEEARVLVPNSRLDHLVDLYHADRKIPAVLKIFDIAGLVRGASDNKGLGNAFLADIRAVDGIFQVVRSFKDPEITHIEGSVDPVRDLTIVQDELLLKDMEFIENELERIRKQMKNRGGKTAQDFADMDEEIATLEEAYDILIGGQRIINKPDWTDNQIDILNRNHFLSTKPSVFLANISEEDYLNGTIPSLSGIEDWVSEFAPGSPVIPISAAYESKYADEHPSAIEGKSALPEIITEMRKTLHLISYFTCGPLECRQWTIRENTLCPQAAGVIHTDFEKTFINAELIKYDDVAGLKPPYEEKILRSKGKIHRVGKSYVVQDSDILTFHSAAQKKQ